MNLRPIPLLRPTIATPGKFTCAVERCSNQLVGHEAGQRPGEFNDVTVGGPTVLAAAVLTHSQRGMRATVPVDNEVNGLAFNACNDLLDQSADDLFLGGGRRSRAGPCTLQVGTKAHQLGAIGGTHALRQRHCVMRLDLILKRSNLPKPSIPARFQLASNQTVVRINSIVLAARARRFKSCMIQAQLKLVAFLGMGVSLGGIRFECRLDAQGLQPRDDLGASLGPPACRRTRCSVRRHD